MGIKGVLNNLKTLGVSGTYEKYKTGAEAKELYQKLTDLYMKRPFEGLSEEEFRSCMDEIYAQEMRLKELRPSLFSEYKKKCKAHYLKELAPALYAEVSKVPVRDKVVFVEKDIVITAPNAYISKVLEEQGKYEVVMMALSMRTGSRIEYFERHRNFIREIADAKAVFITSANEFMSTFDLRPETKLIQLWHGLGIFKKIGYSTLDSKEFGRTLEQMKEYDNYRNYSYVTIPSMEQAWIFEEAMHIPVDSGILVPVGVSRTDQFYDPEFSREVYDELISMFPQIKGKKIILYAPTYRGRISEAYAPNEMDLHMMAEALSDEYVLLIKHHGLCKSFPEVPADLENKFVFDLNRNPIGVIERLLGIADICITDYSSIAFEYALLERPLIFYAYDLEEYMDKRGMYYDYEDITPGPVCKTTKEMVDYILSLADGFDKSEVAAFKEKYVGACDGHSTERTIALIES